MSKKDKSKFRRRLRAEILKGMEEGHSTQSVNPNQIQQASQPVAKPVQAESPSIEKPPAQIVETPAAVENAPTDTLQLVRQDLKKSAIIIGSIIIIIVGLYFIDQKTGILLKAGNEIFKVLHIGA